MRLVPSYMEVVLKEPLWVRMVQGGLATQDLRKLDQGACTSVQRGVGRVVLHRGRRLVLMSTILILAQW